MKRPTAWVTHGPIHSTQTPQFRYPRAGVGEILVDAGLYFLGQTAEYVHYLHGEWAGGIHAIVLCMCSETQLARFCFHKEVFA